MLRDDDIPSNRSFGFSPPLLNPKLRWVFATTCPRDKNNPFLEKTSASYYISQKRMALFECFLNSKKNQVKLFSTSSLIINELYNAFGLAQKIITKKLSFFREKAWSFQIIVISLHSQNGNVYVDVPWCNGSTRVFGSLSPRSNRSGTTSPSLEPCGSIPIFTQDSFLQLCLYDTAFFVLYRWHIRCLDQETRACLHNYYL